MTSDTGELAALPAGAGVASIRDIPASCICLYELDTGQMRYIRTGHLEACPWHGGHR